MKKDLNDEEFLDKIDEWHNGDFECELYEHLSMTLEEYSQMVMKGFKHKLIESQIEPDFELDKILHDNIDDLYEE